MRRIVDSLGDVSDLPAAGRFEVGRVIDGENVTIRGAVVNGVPGIDTAFNPDKFPGGNWMRVPVEPRPLTAKERAVVERILRLGFPGAAEFRHQLDRVRVVALWGPDSASVDLRVADDAPPAPVPDGVVPVTCTVIDEEGELIGEIILWTEAGMLSGLEYAWYGDEPPTSLPEVDRIVVS
ncbi:hypothetical protein GCM10009660_06910 [Catellatospora bangladeshensis]